MRAKLLTKERENGEDKGKNGEFRELPYEWAVYCLMNLRLRSKRVGLEPSLLDLPNTT